MHPIRPTMSLKRLIKRNECVIKIFKIKTGYTWEIHLQPNTETRKRVIVSHGMERARLPMRGRIATTYGANTVRGAIRRAKFEVDLFSK